MISRRNFLRSTSGAGLLGILPAAAVAGEILPDKPSDPRGVPLTVSLDGSWDFCLDPDGRGVSARWFASPDKASGWKQVQVPHTWQVEAEHTDYFGKAWYKKTFFVPASWDGATVRAEFEAVYHSARVWLNGKAVGEHLGKGYTAFWLDLTAALRAGELNTLVVEADNTFSDTMLPRNHSYDWAADGGITRPVSLHVTGPLYTERVAIVSEPDIPHKKATVRMTATVTNTSSRATSLEIVYRCVRDGSGEVAASGRATVKVPAGQSRDQELPPLTISSPALWHFDAPSLYRMEVELRRSGELQHVFHENFGIRKIEVKDAGFYLNGERVWLMGVERMGGSNPYIGMAETSRWILHDHEDLKILNCVFTRAHWQQDKRVLDYCDRHGIFIQCEVPTWGGATFKGMEDQPSEPIMQNGLEQLTELIHRDRNHPCIFSWGLCNEIGGQNPPAYHFAERMLKEAKRLDPERLCSYASNSLQKTPGQDVSRLMDFVEWNEYYESWYPGTVQDMEKNLELIHEAFPEKPLVISEYGWCRCTADRTVGDPKKIDVLRSNDAVFRKHDYVGGLIFFCYNDYRTHIGDKGLGVMKQRVHGVVDLLGARKPSFEVLRYESGPVSSCNAWVESATLHVTLETRKTIPAYTLRGYKLRWVVYADQDIPLETGEVLVPDLAPGKDFSVSKTVRTPGVEKIHVELVRPTGFSVIDKTITERPA